jgi:putative transposase
MPTVTVSRAFKFRLYPTPAQDAELREWERQLRFLYNLGHEQRLATLGRPKGERPGDILSQRGRDLRDRATAAAKSWAAGTGTLSDAKALVREARAEFAAGQRERVTYFRQSREMTELVQGGFDQLGRVVCSARQEVLRDLDKAWQRWRKGLGGRPRFKRRTDSVRIYFSTPKHWSIGPCASPVATSATRKTLSFGGAASSLGTIELCLDRPFPKDAATSSCHLVRDVDQWYAVFPLKFSVDVVPPKLSAVGINRGAVHAIADTDGRVVDSPKHYANAMAKIAKLSRDLKRKEPGGRNYHKAAEKLARAHRKVRRQREFFLHQQSSHYASTYRLIAIEDWSTKDMTAKEPDKTFTTRGAKRAINRSILDVGWYEMARQIKYKVDTSGAEVREVPVFDPGGEEIGISSVCSVCGEALKGPASGRKHMLCGECSHKELGDVNAARNVLVRAENMTPPGKRSPKATIKIKGRRQKRPVAAGNPPVDASGRDPSVRGPDEGRTHERTVSTLEDMTHGNDARHQPTGTGE